MSTTRRQRRSGVEVGKLMHRARGGDREAADALAEEERAAAEQSDPPEEQPRTPRPDPTQGCRGSSVEGTSRMDEGRAMYDARRRPPSYDL